MTTTAQPDLCPICRVFGAQPCVDPKDESVEVPDHAGRSAAHLNTL